MGRQRLGGREFGIIVDFGVMNSIVTLLKNASKH